MYVIVRSASRMRPEPSATERNNASQVGGIDEDPILDPPHHRNAARVEPPGQRSDLVSAQPSRVVGRATVPGEPLTPVPEAERVNERATSRPLLGARHDLWASLVIGLFCMLVYNVNGRAISAGDAFAARYQPFAIWGHGTILLDPIESLTSQGRERPANWQKPHPGAAFWIVPARGGHLVSLYSVVLPVLISPLYLPAVTYVYLQGWTDERIDRVARIMEKLTASFIAALSASLLYLALRRRATVSIATLLTVAYAFGTTTWVISSQALWQHGMAQLLVVGMILLLTTPSTVPRAIAAGLLCGLLAANRPADAVLAAALGVYALFWAGRRAALVGVAASVPALAVLFYNVTIVGALSGAYQLVGRGAEFFRARHDLGARRIALQPDPRPVRLLAHSSYSSSSPGDISRATAPSEASRWR